MDMTMDAYSASVGRSTTFLGESQKGEEGRIRYPNVQEHLLGQHTMPRHLAVLENASTIGEPPKKDIYSPTYLRGNRDNGQVW
jgi:hypothetical protein